MHNILRPHSVLLGMLACCWSLPGQAGPLPDPCVAPANQTERNGCDAKQRYQAADQDLNQAYKQVSDALDQARREQLKQAQRAWIAFRDAECDALAAIYQDNATQTMVQQECLAAQTQARTHALRSAYAPQSAGSAPQGGARRYQAADQALNEVYKQVMARLGKTQGGQLKVAQRAWIAFRDAECAAQSAAQPAGTLRTEAQQGCLADLTQARSEGLRQGYLPAATPQAGGAEAVLGNWRSLASAYGMEIRFGITDGVHHYLSFLNGIPYQAGQWRLRGGQLSITDSTGKLLHVYNQVQVEDGVLYLYEQDGGVEKYQRLPDKQLP